MYASLGNISFTTLEGFTSLSIKEETVYAEFGKMQSLPTLQAASEKAPELSLSIFLKSEFTNVEDSIATLRKARKKTTILPLIWGNGKKEGYYVITSMDVSVTNQLADGTFIEANVSLSLKQYQEAEIGKQLQIQIVTNAKAVGLVQPISKIGKNILKGKQSIVKNIQSSVTNINTIKNEQKNLTSNLQDKAEKAKTDILKATADFNKQMTAIKNEAQKGQDAVKEIVDKATNAQQAAQDYYNAIANNVGNSADMANNVYAKFNDLHTQARDIINTTITRIP